MRLYYASRCTTKKLRLILLLRGWCFEYNECMRNKHNEKQNGPHSMRKIRGKTKVKHTNTHNQILYSVCYPIPRYHPSNTFTTNIEQGHFLNRTLIWGARRQTYMGCAFLKVGYHRVCKLDLHFLQQPTRKESPLKLMLWIIGCSHYLLHLTCIMSWDASVWTTTSLDKCIPKAWRGHMICITTTSGLFSKLITI